MAKRNFAALIAVSAIGLTAHEACAQQVTVAVDGCGRLARIIYSEVSAAAIYGPGRSGPWVIDSEQGDISICPHAAKTVSRAFTSALRRTGIHVSWNGRTPASGGHCLSGYLSECYPDRDPLLGSLPNADLAFVQRSWEVVSQSVMHEMYNPFSSDEVRFRDNDLKLRLGLSLRLVGAKANRQLRSPPNLQ